MENNEAVKKLPFVGAKIDKVLNGDSATKAFATITIAGNFMVHNIKVIEGNKGLFVAMPNRSYQDANGETKYSDICHSITSEMKERIDSIVLKAYNQEIGEVQDETAENGISDEDTPTESPDNSDPEDVSSMFYVPTM